MRVIAALGRSDPAHPRPEPSLETVQALVEARTGGGMRVSDPVWLSNFRINERKVSEYRRAAYSWRATPRTSIARPAVRA